MPAKKRRSPGEKKALSLTRDRRNAYGDNNKASRKGIPRKRAHKNRTVRRAASRAVALATIDTDAAETRLAGIRPSEHLRKYPDIPLGDFLSRRDQAKAGYAHCAPLMRQLKQALAAAPFRPFTIHLTGGASFRIKHPPQVLIPSRTSRYIHLVGKDEKSLTAIDLLQVATITPAKSGSR